MGVLSGLQPEPVYRFFEEICQIPHGSGNTKRISDYCVAFAGQHGFRWQQDTHDNVIIWKDGTKGYEQAAPVILQGHLDMVCEKEAGYAFDFLEDSLRLRVENGTIFAEGTTLGGDDGIAVAYALAILESQDIAHPPLEVVLTADEEIGMLGAAALDCSSLKGRTMLNIDSEEEGYLLVSCAGGVTVSGQLPITRKAVEGQLVELRVHGLLGGHSGVEIDKGRANANRILGRGLYQLRKRFPFWILDVAGGKKDNAIPREAGARILLPKQTNINDFIKQAENFHKLYQKEWAAVDPALTLTCIAQRKMSAEVMTEEDADRVITALMTLPEGVQKMSSDIAGLVQTSLNLGILETHKDTVVFSFAVRSSVESEKEEVVSRIECLMEALGGTVSCQGAYPAWEYQKESPLRQRMVEIYREKYGKEPVVQAIHAGVECGLFAGKLSGLDCVSFGPDMKDIHTPQETMDVESVRRTWEYLLEILKRF